MIKSIILNLMKNFTYLNNRISLSFLLLSITIGSLIRLYNLNYDNLWFDEIVSFWVSDPAITIKESYHRHFQTEGVPFFFNFLLKIFHKVFGYDASIGRYFSSILGILSIFSVTYLSKILSKNNAYLLTLFLISTNIFLISYSQEVRLFMMVFFLTSINLIFFFKLIDSNGKKINLNLITFLFILSSLVLQSLIGDPIKLFA